jgi:hypothetical protein
MKNLLENKKMLMGLGALFLVVGAAYVWHKNKEEKCSCKGIENTTPPTTTFVNDKGPAPLPSPAPPSASPVTTPPSVAL